MTLEQILKARQKTEVGSDEWNEYNAMKIKLLEQIKPSTREGVFYYYSKDIRKLPYGFTPATHLLPVHLYVANRSVLEYDSGFTRHIIPYCIIRNGDEYYFALREGGSEARLKGKIGLLGGHVGKEGITQGMLRELEEEAGILERHIRNYKMKGYIKLLGNKNDPFDVNKDHLGLVYEVNIKTKDIRMEEKDILKGFWVHKSKLHEVYDQMEDWAKLLVKEGVIK